MVSFAGSIFIRLSVLSLLGDRRVIVYYNNGWLFVSISLNLIVIFIPRRIFLGFRNEGGGGANVHYQGSNVSYSEKTRELLCFH